MTALENTPLNARFLRIEGPDAMAFTQAQFCCDNSALQVHQWQWGAWLDAKGRIRALFQIARVGEQHLMLLLRGGDAERMALDLGRFVFRSKVQLTPLKGGTLADGPQLAEGEARLTGDTLELGDAEYSLGIADTPHAAQEFRLTAIRQGHPWLDESLRERFLPPALCLRRLGAISHAKGCFPGQEIAARLHYRGGHKHGLFHIALHQSMPPGSTLPAKIDGKHEVSILDCATGARGPEALAIMHQEAAHALPRAPDTPTAERPLLLQDFSV